jgi:hypothetical protein
MPAPDDLEMSRRGFLVAGAVAGAACLALARGGAAEKEAEGIAPFRIGGDRLLVPAGHYGPADARVRVTAATELRVDPAEVVTVKDEPLQLGDKPPSGFFVGAHLQSTLAGRIGAFGSLIGESVIVRDASGRTLRRGEDYLVSAPFALLGIGPKPSIEPTTPVLVSYSHFLQRIDTVAVDVAGRASLVRGVPHVAMPAPAAVPPGAAAIARVYRPFGATGLSEAHVFPIVARASEAKTATTTGRLPRTLAKLRAGEPVKVVCWGDSITVGGDVAPEDAWANRLRRELARAFPAARIEHANHSIGGTKSAQWLHNGDFPGLPKQNPVKCRFDLVLGEMPDVVVMEFLNDIVFNADVLRQTYDAIDAAFRSRGIEWLIVTPSQKVPQPFDLAEMKDGRPRLLDTFLRDFAAQRGHALADAAARWKHLHREGIPYFALFGNAFNHPNAYGHGLFIEEIMKCFQER